MSHNPSVRDLPDNTLHTVLRWLGLVEANSSQNTSQTPKCVGLQHFLCLIPGVTPHVGHRRWGELGADGYWGRRGGYQSSSIVRPPHLGSKKGAWHNSHDDPFILPCSPLPRSPQRRTPTRPASPAKEPAFLLNSR